MQEVEICMWCNKTEVTPKGKEIYEGREVNMVECKRCGIVLVSTKDLPTLDNAFKCANLKCKDNHGSWCKLTAPCESSTEYEI
jgi:hypothetical protein